MLSTIKRIASDLLKVGVSKIRIKDEEREKAEKAMTREDVRNLIRDKVIYVKRAKRVKKERKKKKRAGQGKRKGTKNARKPSKEKWMERVRAQRKYLNQLVGEGHVPKEYKREIYLKIKGGSFRGKKAMLAYLKDNKIYKE